MCLKKVCQSVALVLENHSSSKMYSPVFLQYKPVRGWHEHPRYIKADPCCLLIRREQVTEFRFRTGHNGLNYHLYSKFRIGHIEQCPCGTGSQTTEHLLLFCAPSTSCSDRETGQTNSHSPQTLQQPGGPTTYCHLHCRDWSFLLTNVKKYEVFLRDCHTK